MTRPSEITMETATEAATEAASGIKRAGRAIWKRVRAFGQAAPRVVAALLLIAAVAVPSAYYFGAVSWPKPDATLQMQIEGVAASINDIKRDIETLAAKGDLAAIAARVSALETQATKAPAPSQITTGSISRPKK